MKVTLDIPNGYQISELKLVPRTQDIGGTCVRPLLPGPSVPGAVWDALRESEAAAEAASGMGAK